MWRGRAAAAVDVAWRVPITIVPRVAGSGIAPLSGAAALGTAMLQLVSNSSPRVAVVLSVRSSAMSPTLRNAVTVGSSVVLRTVTWTVNDAARSMRIGVTVTVGVGRSGLFSVSLVLRLVRSKYTRRPGWSAIRSRFSSPRSAA